MSVANTVGAAAAIVGVPVVGTIATLAGDVIHTSSAGPNQDAVTALTPLALASNPNVVAWKATYKRATYITVQADKTEWAALWSQIVAKFPMAATIAGDGPSKPPGVPEEWILGVAPEAVLPQVQQITQQLGNRAYLNYYLTGGQVNTQALTPAAPGNQPPVTSGILAGILPAGTSSFGGLLLIAGLILSVYFLVKNMRKS